MCNCAHTGFVGLNCEIQRTIIDVACNINLTLVPGLNPTATCKNAATCNTAPFGQDLDSQNFETCECPENYSGVDCSVNSSPCELSANNPCQNSGECFGTLRDYKCVCKPGFTGKNCETDISQTPCERQNPCQNGGSCVNGFELRETMNINGMAIAIEFVETSSCDCSAVSFEGEFCQSPIDRSIAATRY